MAIIFLSSIIIVCIVVGMMLLFIIRSEKRKATITQQPVGLHFEGKGYKTCRKCGALYPRSDLLCPACSRFEDTEKERERINAIMEYKNSAGVGTQEAKIIIDRRSLDE